MAKGFNYITLVVNFYSYLQLIPFRLNWEKEQSSFCLKVTNFQKVSNQRDIPSYKTRKFLHVIFFITDMLRVHSSELHKHITSFYPCTHFPVLRNVGKPSKYF